MYKQKKKQIHEEIVFIKFDEVLYFISNRFLSTSLYLYISMSIRHKNKHKFKERTLLLLSKSEMQYI